MSDTFLVCLRKIDRVPVEALPWLYAVARKTLANERRKRARVVHGNEVSVGEPNPVGDGVLAVAFNGLSERDREVLRLVAWEGLSLADAAIVLGCSPVACRVRYHRAKSRLASRLNAATSFQPQPKGVTR
ncbi:MAG: RNA polymerase sigma factor [Gaiellaceae bacterium]